MPWAAAAAFLRDAVAVTVARGVVVVAAVEVLAVTQEMVVMEVAVLEVLALVVPLEVAVAVVKYAAHPIRLNRCL